MMKHFVVSFLNSAPLVVRLRFHIEIVNVPLINALKKCAFFRVRKNFNYLLQVYVHVATVTTRRTPTYAP